MSPRLRPGPPGGPASPLTVVAVVAPHGLGHGAAARAPSLALPCGSAGAVAPLSLSIPPSVPSLLPSRPGGTFYRPPRLRAVPWGVGRGRAAAGGCEAGRGEGRRAAAGRAAPFSPPLQEAEGCRREPAAPFIPLPRGTPQPAQSRERERGGCAAPRARGERAGRYWCWACGRNGGSAPQPPRRVVGPGAGGGAAAWRAKLLRKLGEPARRQGRTPARPSLRGSPPSAGSVVGVRSARMISGELPGRAGLGALASLFSQMLPLNSSERHRVCLKEDLVACKTTPLRQASLCQPQGRPFLAIWSNSGLTSGWFSFAQGALHQMCFLVLGNCAVNISARKTDVFQAMES